MADEKQDEQKQRDEARDARRIEKNERADKKRPTGEKSLLFKRRQERLAKLRENAAPKRVRVFPRDDRARAITRGTGRDAFPPEGSVEWPLDTFTKRRLRAGSVRLETDSEKQAREQQRSDDRQRNAGGKDQRNRNQSQAPAPAPSTTS